MDKENKAKQLAQLSEKLAVARLEHEVKSLETEVLNILKSSLSKKAFVLSVFDASALIDSLKIIKSWIGIKSVKIVIPFFGRTLFCAYAFLLMLLLALEELDRLKKGTDVVNVNARSVIRFLERFSNNTPDEWTIRMQKPSETVDWRECVPLFSLNPESLDILLKYNTNQKGQFLIESKYTETITANKTPRSLRSLICFMVYLQKNIGTEFSSCQLITHDPITIAWAKLFSIQTFTVAELTSNIALNNKEHDNSKKKYNPLKKRFKSTSANPSFLYSEEK
ncbi:hypothetical protein T552_02398 [Pneumocystis carinii B80]|uniref:PIN domain-containing protein n=1 Tax=Pneumocystis carinii (strain B80) TaxID=1408658 RepID=A0A0W4ZGA2_PNEC8|nr:hypothetical protein T552_02398 [Pneumocystis carinii B80]KTW27420.1 hypothetical protein T552_02398 [Pneumocystis carinii B80]